MKTRRNWHKFERVHVELNPEVLRIIDYLEGIVWVNTSPMPSANVVRLLQ